MTTPKTYYKAFGPGLVCRGFRYEVGKTYTQNGWPKMCGKAFHACPRLVDTLNHYPITAEFARVQLSGTVVEGVDKLAAQAITVIEVMTWREAFLQIHTEITVAATQSENVATEDHSHSATTGYLSHSATTGYHSHSATTGIVSHSATTGSRSRSVTAGNESHSATTGHLSHSATVGNYSQSVTTGHYSQSVTTGTASHSATTGHRSHSVTVGDRSRSATTGRHAIAASLGIKSRAKCGAGGMIVVAEYTDEGDLVDILVGRPGRNIKADTWYRAVGGRLVECDDE